MKRIWVVLFLFSCTPIQKEVDQTISPPDHWFEIETLASHFNEPQEMEILLNGDVLFIERGGAIKKYDSQKEEVVTIQQLPVIHSQSNGLTGMALAPNFPKTGWLYVMYPEIGDTSYLQINRFTFSDDQIDLASKQNIFKIPVELRNGWHGEDALAFDSKGNLYISLGDFSLQSGDIAGYAQIDERPEHIDTDAQRTSANSNDYRGKILRIHPEEDGSYTIPEGNLFGTNDSSGKPEIYVMGCRNPYRFILDPLTDILYFGDVGPDAWDDHEKGPKGYDEVNIVQESGFYGWPYFVADNKPYRDFDYKTKTVDSSFNPLQPINDSPNNNGIKQLPPAQPAVLWYPKSPSSIFPYLGQGGMNIMVGPMYYPDIYPESKQKLPDYYAGKLFIYDWVRNWIRTIEFDEKHQIVAIEPFLDSKSFNKIIDMELGSDGSLYLLEYGGKGYQENEDAALKRIVYAEGNPKPQLASQPSIDSTKMLPDVPGYERGRELITTSNCLSCHLVEGKLIGPGFLDIAMRYESQENPQGYLSQKILEGGSGEWEGNIIMPANAHLTPQEANLIVSYIMTLQYLVLE